MICRDRVLKSQLFRRRFVAQLQIPTYCQLKKVMFFDVIQQLCDKKNFQLFHKERLRKERLKE